MRRWPMITAAVLAAAALCAGCASSDHLNSQGAGSGTLPAGGSAVPSSAPPASVTGAPAPSVPPTGPVATAATGSPPALGTHAVAAIDGAVVSCPDGAPLLPAPGDDGRSPLPASVTIKAVVRCETVERTYAGIGFWSVQLVEVADSEISDFVAALRAPSQKQPTNVICPMFAVAVPWFAVVDASGQVLRPSLPTNQCGQPSGLALRALSKLDFRVVDAVRVRLEPTPGPATSGCGGVIHGMPPVADHPTAAPAASPYAQGSSSASSRVVCPYSK